MRGSQAAIGKPCFFSEDMTDGAKYGSVTVSNPFRP